MRKTTLMLVLLFSSLALVSCSQENKEKTISDLNNNKESLYRYVDGTFSARIDANVKDIYNATETTLRNSEKYNIDVSKVNNESAELAGTTKNGREFNVQINSEKENVSYIYIKIDSLKTEQVRTLNRNKDQSKELLANIRQGMGI